MNWPSMALHIFSDLVFLIVGMTIGVHKAAKAVTYLHYRMGVRDLAIKTMKEIRQERKAK